MSSIRKARELAQALDIRLSGFPRTIDESGISTFIRIRGYLLKQDRRLGTQHNLEEIVRFEKTAGGGFQIFLGPTIDKGPDPTFFIFPSGARLSFSIALRELPNGSEIIAYRFQYTFPQRHSPEFIRIDLNSKSHSDPLAEPLAHIHPRSEEHTSELQSR